MVLFCKAAIEVILAKMYIYLDMYIYVKGKISSMQWNIQKYGTPKVGVYEYLFQLGLILVSK